MKNNKVGLAIITCDRQNFFEKCVQSIPEGCVDKLVVVNDGAPYPKESYPKHINEVIQHTRPYQSVGISKNHAFRWLMLNEVDHLFVMEDDVFIKDPKIFEKHIELGQKTGLWHSEYHYHGPANRDENYQLKPRKIIDYGNGVKAEFAVHLVGAFCYYLKGIIKSIGVIDEHYNKSSWDHVEHTYRIIKSGLLPAMWWMPGIYEQEKYIQEQASTDQSVIRSKTTEWKQAMAEGAHWFKYKHGCFPTEVPDTPETEVLKRLKEIKQKYARKVL